MIYIACDIDCIFYELKMDYNTIINLLQKIGSNADTNLLV